MSVSTENSQGQQSTAAKESLAAIDPKWARRHLVIEALEDYRLRLNARSSLQDRYDTLCARLYSGRSSRITGMPTNHDQFAAGDHFAEMLDEKMELERALAAEAEQMDDVRNALDYIDGQSRLFLEQFYLGANPKKALTILMRGLGYSAPAVYKIRNAALDKLYNILYAEA